MHLLSERCCPEKVNQLLTVENKFYVKFRITRKIHAKNIFITKYNKKRKSLCTYMIVCVCLYAGL